ncbi:hypothetical protein D9M71_520090 [compost metagenome]
MGRFGRTVVRHGTVGIESGDGRKAQRHEAGATGTGSAELLIDGQLSNRLAPQRDLEPGEELT